MHGENIILSECQVAMISVLIIYDSIYSTEVSYSEIRNKKKLPINLHCNMFLVT